MSDQRNLIIAIILSIAVFVGYEYFFPTPKKEPVDSTVATSTQVTPGTQAPLPQPGSATAPGPAFAAGSASAPVARATAVNDTGPRIQIETPRLKGSIRLKGAVFDDITLVGYRESVDKDSPQITTLSPRGTIDPYYAVFGWQPAERNGAIVPDADSLWEADHQTLTVSQPVTLRWDNGQGLRFLRTISIDENFMLTVIQTVENQGSTPVTLVPYGQLIREVTPKTSGYYVLHEGPLGVFDGTLKEVNYSTLKDDFKDKKGVDADIQEKTTGGWIGITDKYWLSALVIDQDKSADARFGYFHPNTQSQDGYHVSLTGTPVTIAAGASATSQIRLFSGAKEFDLMNQYAKNLGITEFAKAIDFGWFWFLTIPFTWCLKELHGILGNMGLAIIIFTCFLKLLFFPLANKSYVSMSKMKLLGPELKKLQERFKDDKVRLNQEMMALYRKEKVNPMSGCLPILIQIPVFFALYKTLFVSIEMRHAPFFGWIQDLSMPDPTSIFNLFGLIPWDPPSMLMIGVWPCLMGLTMFLQQKLNPAPTDPIQARVLMLLPLIFTFMFAHFAAGLVLYWTVNNTLSILQQWFIIKRMERQKNRATA